MLKKLYKWCVPVMIRDTICNIIAKRNVMAHLKRKYEMLSEEQKEIYKFLIGNSGMTNYPYMFQNKYLRRRADIQFDLKNEMYFVTESNRRIYLKKGMSENECRKYYNSISLEQDMESPHRYLSNSIKMVGEITEKEPPPWNGDSTQNQSIFSFLVAENDVVLDIGTAEGNFALSVIDKAKKIYLFECDESWVKALRLTFRGYEDKVEIISKFVSDRDTEMQITIDTFMKRYGCETVNFIKMDIEGCEEKALTGATETLSAAESGMKLAVCTYHNFNDDFILKSRLENFDFETKFTDGYLLYVHDKDYEHPLRKAVLRATKK